MVVCMCVCQSVGHEHVRCQNCRTDRDVVWNVDSREAVGTKQPLLGRAADRWGMCPLGGLYVSLLRFVRGQYLNLIR